MRKKDPLSETDRSLATELALRAMQSIGKAKFTVYAALDIAKPKTINRFDTFGEVLLAAYKRGVADTETKQAALEADREHDAMERG
jgi:hypothetical protein